MIAVVRHNKPTQSALTNGMADYTRAEAGY